MKKNEFLRFVRYYANADCIHSRNEAKEMAAYDPELARLRTRNLDSVDQMIAYCKARVAEMDAGKGRGS